MKHLPLGINVKKEITMKKRLLIIAICLSSGAMSMDKELIRQGSSDGQTDIALFLSNKKMEIKEKIQDILRVDNPYNENDPNTHTHKFINEYFNLLSDYMYELFYENLDEYLKSELVESEILRYIDNYIEQYKINHYKSIK